MKTMSNKMKYFLFGFAALTIVVSGCKKGTFDINSPNPNVPSSVPVNYSLASALKESADLMYNSNEDFLQYWMGYWSVSGDYIPSNSVVLYQLTTDYYSGNWDGAYLNLKNYKVIENASTDESYSNYLAISKIMQAFVYQRIVDLYNNAPYTEALKSGDNFFPSYVDGATIYKSLIAKVDSAVTLIKGATVNAITPGSDDILFKGDMDSWVKFANTLKLKLLLRTTAKPVVPIQSSLSGLTAADFLGAGEDAAVNPGYKNVISQQNPQYADIGFDPSGSETTDHKYFRANTYAINFYKSTNDPRIAYFYMPTQSAGEYVGRQFGSTGGNEHNPDISGVDGPGVLKGPTQDAVILPAFESLFLQAEAAERGYLSGNATDLYNSAVSESFRILGVNNYDSAATAFTSQNNANTNYTTSTNKLKTLITQKWASLNAYDPLESYSDWRRLAIPSNLPISIYPGNTNTHVPYRLPYPSSEYNYNSTNVNGQGKIDPNTNKIFWMP